MPGSTARLIASSANAIESDTETGVWRAIAREQLRVAPHERPLRDDRDGVAKLGADLEAAPRQLVRRLERLVAVRVAREDDDVALPGAARDLVAQQLRRVRLDDDLALEVRPGAEAEVLVGGAGVAVAHAWKHPRYGLRLYSNPTSGLSFFERIERARSSKTSSFASGGSPSHSAWTDSQGFGGLETGLTMEA